MGRTLKHVIAWPLAALAALAAFQLRNPSSSDARERLEAEIRQFPAFVEHEAVLLGTIERAHERVFSDNVVNRRRRRVLDWDSYRAQMYAEMRGGLGEAGFPGAAIQLDRYRARE